MWNVPSAGWVPINPHVHAPGRTFPYLGCLAAAMRFGICFFRDRHSNGSNSPPLILSGVFFLTTLQVAGSATFPSLCPARQNLQKHPVGFSQLRSRRPVPNALSGTTRRDLPDLVPFGQLHFLAGESFGGLPGFFLYGHGSYGEKQSAPCVVEMRCHYSKI